MATEVELGLTISEPELIDTIWNDPDIRGLMETPPTETRMRSHYFDTPGLDLTARRWVLRLRLENDAAVLYFKTDRTRRGGMVTRDEFKCLSADPLCGAADLVRQGAPEELYSLVRQHGVQERCRIEFVRRHGLLRLSDGTEIELCTDQGRILAGDRSEDLLELECELQSGKPARMRTWAATLQKRYSLTPLTQSKYERALALL